MSEKPTRNKIQEAQRRQAALHRVMYWCLKIQQQKDRMDETNPIRLETYDDRISAICLLKRVTEAHHFENYQTYDIGLIHHTQAMKLLVFRIFYAELHFNPWGIATERLCGRKAEQNGKVAQLSRLPNFLLPTSCLYCGEPLGYKTYAETSLKITKHPDCANAWNKGIRKKHLEAIEAIKSIGEQHHNSPEVIYAFDKLWNSYMELIPLYETLYVPRYSLIEAYQDIPISACFDPISGFRSRGDLLALPFLKDEVQEFGLALSEEEDGAPLRWNSYDPQAGKPAIVLSELDAYFIADP